MSDYVPPSWPGPAGPLTCRYPATWWGRHVVAPFLNIREGFARTIQTQLEAEWSIEHSRMVADNVREMGAARLFGLVLFCFGVGFVIRLWQALHSLGRTLLGR